MTTALEGGEGSASRPGRSLPPGNTRYPLYRRLGGPQGRSGQVRKISHPPGFDPRTVQPVASRYTDYTTRPTFKNKCCYKFNPLTSLCSDSTMDLGSTQSESKNSQYVGPTTLSTLNANFLEILRPLNILEP